MTQYEAARGGPASSRAWLAEDGRAGRPAGPAHTASSDSQGSRRRKFAGYLRAANELRQSYQSSYAQTWRSRPERWDEGLDHAPDAFPDAAIVRGGDEEMVIFPTYARQHVRRKPDTASAADASVEKAEGLVTDVSGAGDISIAQQQWQNHEEDGAVVDVDVHGWVYTAFKGPMTRKQRLFVGLARQLVGLPAANAALDTTPAGSTLGSRDPSPRTPSSLHNSFSANADSTGLSPDPAGLDGEIGKLKEELRQPKLTDPDAGSIESRPSRSASPLPDGATEAVVSQLYADVGDGVVMTAARRRQSWGHPSTMTQAELTTANSHLMARLKPFLANPMESSPVSAFFYNDTTSRQKTVYTNQAGHFALRAALDFIPTHVRILAGEHLSATEEVGITAAQGVSLISDIDDTVKHSAISSGAREIFRNTFIRDLGDLSIEGVREWYGRLAAQGVQLHYVSNSPWQLYPVLRSFISASGLPHGSIHLKQYSGMLQGIFEPVAERKKSTLERILRDFPERKFLLVGDSGEADLEVYTEVAVENPGRVLGIYIRDVTTPGSLTSHSADSILTSVSGSSTAAAAAEGAVYPAGLDGSSNGGVRHYSTMPSRGEWDDDSPELRAAIAASLEDLATENEREEVRLLERQNGATPKSDERTQSPGQVVRKALPKQPASPTAVDLISFPEDEEGGEGDQLAEDADGAMQKRRPLPPLPPSKPLALRSRSTDQDEWAATDPIKVNMKPAPTSPPLPTRPLPRKPSRSVHVRAGGQVSPPAVRHQSPPLPPRKMSATMRAERGGSPSRTVNGQQRKPVPARRQQLQHPQISTIKSAISLPSSYSPHPPAPPPARRGLSSYPAIAAQQATHITTRAAAAAAAAAAGLKGSDGSATHPGRAGGRHSFATSASSATSSTPGQSRSTTPSSAADGAYVSTAAIINKKEELWRRRWARAQAALRPRGVILRTWRVGTDVLPETEKLVQHAQEEFLKDS